MCSGAAHPPRRRRPHAIPALLGSACLGWALLLAPAGALSAELRDPTRPALGVSSTGVSPLSRPPRFKLTSVLIAPARRVAVINGSSVSLGDRVAGARVVEIGPRYVRLERGGLPVELFLNPRSVELQPRRSPLE